MGVIGVVEARVIEVAGVVRSQDVERSGRGSWQEDEREIGGREGSGRSTSWLMDYTSFKGLNNCFVLQFVGYICFRLLAYEEHHPGRLWD